MNLTCWLRVLKHSPRLMPLLCCPGGADLSSAPTNLYDFAKQHKVVLCSSDKQIEAGTRSAFSSQRCGHHCKSICLSLWLFTSKNHPSYLLSIKVMSKSPKAIQRKLGIFSIETGRSESLRLGCKEISTTGF